MHAALRMRAITAAFLGRAAPLLGAALILAACGSGAKPEEAAGAAQTGQKPAVRKALPGSAISPNMVSAVSGAHTGSDFVQLKFELRERPRAAQPLDIDIAIVPGLVDRVYGRFEVSEGLELSDGEQIAPIDRPVESMPLRHTLKVRPRKDGIFTVNALVSVEAGGQTSTQTFSIPVIVGAGAPDLAVKPAATAATTKPAKSR